MSSENGNNNEVSQEQMEEKKENVTAESAKITALPVQTINGFNTEEFLARVNMNEKINYLLRSPTKTPNGTRQRSVFTSITSQSRFNASAAPFISQQHRLSGSSSMTPKDTSTPTGSMAQRQLPIPVHMTASPHHYGGYESPLTGRSGGITRNVFNARYPVAPPPSPIYGFENDMCRMAPTISPSHHAQQFPQPMPPPPYAVGRLSASYRGVDYENPTPPPCPGAGPIAMTNGTIQLRLRDGIRIDMTLDKAVRVLNQRSMVAIALSRNCSNSALIHPNGRILQSGSKVEIVTYDGMKTNNYVRYAKMWYKGVSFTSELCALIYLVDTAGTRTTTDTFTDLTKDYTLTVFYDDSRHGPSYVQDANEVIQNSSYTCTDEGTEIYDINGFRITQAADGLVKLTRTHNKCLIRTSPGNGSATLTTPGIHCTASLGKTSHLFVRRNEKRMHFDGSCFIVRNAGHSAGFNENNLLIVY
ncbi:wurstfest [Cochliomyia hominivorax]